VFGVSEAFATAFGSPHHSRLNGSASEIKSGPRLSLLGGFRKHASLRPAWEQIHDHYGSNGSEHKDATDD